MTLKTYMVNVKYCTPIIANLVCKVKTDNNWIECKSKILDVSNFFLCYFQFICHHSHSTNIGIRMLRLFKTENCKQSVLSLLTYFFYMVCFYFLWSHQKTLRLPMLLAGVKGEYWKGMGYPKADCKLSIFVVAAVDLIMSNMDKRSEIFRVFLELTLLLFRMLHLSGISKE